MTHCSQRQPPPNIFTPRSCLCGRLQTFVSVFNEESHSNRVVIWTGARQRFIYPVSPGGTVLGSEGHPTLGEGGIKGDRLEMTCCVDSSVFFFFFCFSVFISLSAVVSLFPLAACLSSLLSGSVYCNFSCSFVGLYHWCNVRVSCLEFCFTPASCSNIRLPDGSILTKTE